MSKNKFNELTTEALLRKRERLIWSNMGAHPKEPSYYRNIREIEEILRNRENNQGRLV